MQALGSVHVRVYKTPLSTDEQLMHFSQRSLHAHDLTKLSHISLRVQRGTIFVHYRIPLPRGTK